VWWVWPVGVVQVRWPDGAAAGILRGPGGIGKSTLVERVSRVGKA
jgi:hypothetical protein